MLISMRSKTTERYLGVFFEVSLGVTRAGGVGLILIK